MDAIRHSRAVCWAFREEPGNRPRTGTLEVRAPGPAECRQRKPRSSQVRSLAVAVSPYSGSQATSLRHRRGGPPPLAGKHGRTIRPTSSFQAPRRPLRGVRCQTAGWASGRSICGCVGFAPGRSPLPGGPRGQDPGTTFEQDDCHCAACVWVAGPGRASGSFSLMI